MAILAPYAFEFFSHSPEQTRRVGVRLGMLLQPGMVVCLQGDLGSGKTTLVQGIAQAGAHPTRFQAPLMSSSTITVILMEVSFPMQTPTALRQTAGWMWRSWSWTMCSKMVC